MLAEVIGKLTKADENANVTSEQMLVWVKRIEA